MADSLVIAGQIELLGQDSGVPSKIPSCAGAIFRLGAGYDLGAPAPTVDILGQLAGDGERPFGRRASNRAVKLPVVIEVPPSALATDPRKTLAAAREALLAAVDQQTWTLTWTRSGGSPLVLDCFRAQPAVITYELAEDASLVSELELSFQALPYGRADQQVQVAFPVPVPGTPPPPPAPVVLDSFASITGAQWAQSSQCVVGPFTAYWDPGAFPALRPDGAGTPLAYSASLPSPVNLTGLPALSLWAGLGAQQGFYVNLEYRGRTRAYLAFTLTDASGRTLSFQSSRRIPVSGNVFAPAWTYVTAAIPQGAAGFDYTRVAAYSITVTNRAGEFRWCHAYLDALTAQPPSQQAGPANTRGSVYQLAGIQGTSHAPVSLTFQQAPTPGSPSTLTGTGSYTVPPGTVTLKVEATGGGGAGASMTAAGVGGGGGGGEYAREDALPVVPGQVIPYQCGIAGTPGASPVNGGDTTFGGGPGQTAVVAHGGQSTAQNSATGGQGGTGSANSVRFPGGQGRTASGSVGGGGGSSAGTSGPGLTPTGTAATAFTTPGTSTWTCPPGVTSVLAEAWGAGGGGAAASAAYYGGGAAGGGEYAAQTVAVTPGHVYSYTVGAAGTAGPATGNPGGTGGSSSFTGDSSVTVTAHGGQGGGVNTYNQGGQGGQGGTGSTAASSFPGGQGGTGYPYSGGGGSSAGPGSAGNSGDGYGDPGPAPSGGGSGGQGRTANGAGSAGSAPGGGGGASYNPGYAGGAGAAGQVRLTYPGGGAPTNNGAAAVPGGGAGGNGGPSANSPGSAGSAPGGGGGGADSTGTTEAGGSGGAGRIIVTPFASAAFKTLVAHRPGPDAPPSLNPLVPVGNGADAPDGTHQYPVPSLVTGVGARFGGTYTGLLVNFTWNNPTAARTITVTVTQAEYAGGNSYATSATTTVTPSTGVTNGLVTVGELTLPYKDIAPDNQGAVFTVSVTSSNTLDRFLDFILLDTTGETVIVSEPSSGYVTYYADEPDPDRDLGRVLGSQFGRPDAISVMDAAILSGGPLTVDPAAAAAVLLVYAVEGSPAVAMSYFSRFYLDRV